MARKNNTNTRRSSQSALSTSVQTQEPTYITMDEHLEDMAFVNEGLVAEDTAGDPLVEAAMAENEANVMENSELTEEEQDELLAEQLLAEGLVTEDGDPVVAEPVGEETPAEPEAVTPEPIVAADPFADLPVVTVGEYEFRDLTEATVSEPRKYEGVHRDAIAAKAHMKKGWKHAAAMIALGTNKIERKPGSVYGTIQSLVAQYGRAGIPAYVLVAKVRQAQIGNKRSHYCTALPPVGWAEGWIDTFISKSMGKIMEKKAPPITAEVVAEIQAGDVEAVAKIEELSQAA